MEERGRCLTFCQEKGVLFSTVQNGHVYSIHLFKKTHNLYFLFIIPDIFKAIKIFKVVCLVIWQGSGSSRQSHKVITLF